jgi:nucleotide-binding universal stress UspA family protein
MYSKIMVPTDGSGFDREAIRVALRIAGKSGAKVRLVRVVSSAKLMESVAPFDGVEPSVEVLENWRNSAQSELEALAAECISTSKADISVDLLDGPIAERLEGYAQGNKFDLIVISSHGRGGMSRLSLGSVTDSLIRHTQIPVLVVKSVPSYLNPRASDTFRRIIVPLDGSTLAEQILPRVRLLAKLEESDVTLLHVLAPQNQLHEERADLTPPWWSRHIAVSKAYLARIEAKMRREGLLVATEVVVGENVPRAICDYATSQRADLIAIATHGRGGLARMIRGSVADAVTRSSRISMLVFRPEKRLQHEVSTVRKGEESSLEPELALA